MHIKKIILYSIYMKNEISFDKKYLTIFSPSFLCAKVGSQAKVYK